jgi:hypothetical protein
MKNYPVEHVPLLLRDLAKFIGRAIRATGLAGAALPSAVTL